MLLSRQLFLEDFVRNSVNFDDINTKVTLQIWDTAGQEKFKAIVGNYYKDAN